MNVKDSILSLPSSCQSVLSQHLKCEHILVISIFNTLSIRCLLSLLKVSKLYVSLPNKDTFLQKKELPPILQLFSIHCHGVIVLRDGLIPANFKASVTMYAYSSLLLLLSKATLTKPFWRIA